MRFWPVPSTIEITSEMANTRTPSASARVTKNIDAVSLRIRSPNLRRISSYAVNISPRKYCGKKRSEIAMRASRYPSTICRNPRLPLKAKAGRSDNGEGAGFGGNDGKGDRPPGRCASAQEIIAQRLFGRSGNARQTT